MCDFTDKLKPARPGGPEALARERSSSRLPIQELSQHLFTGSDFLKRQERVLKDVAKEKLFSKANQINLSRPDRYKLGLARAKLIRRMAEKLAWDADDVEMAEYLVDDVSPYLLQMTMFITTIREQGDEEQQAYWLPLIEQWKIYGAYAQTELGHGSNVKGLELRATYEPHSKEFILHSPTLTASKWWNGSLGRTATHTIVVAQLYLPRSGQRKTGKLASVPRESDLRASSTTSDCQPGQGPHNDEDFVSLGPHPFIIQVRDAKTHKPLPGIAIGDIGAKYGYHSMDNSFVLFDNHRIPHSAFLARYFQVDPRTGAYTSKARNPSIIYGTLTSVRVRITLHARLVLARAVTVAVRYLCIRRQFRDRDDTGNTGPEMTVLDYPSVQIRVLPLLATTYALHYTGIAMGRQYAEARRAIENEDFSTLADMHATSSGLKSLCTTYAADGIETCRRALGGHGFGGGSGLIQLNNDYLSKPTVEGDNWMITQQTASYLIKKTTNIVKGTSTQGSGSDDHITTPLQAYVAHMRSGNANENFHLNIIDSDLAIVQAFEMRAAHLSYKAYLLRVEQKRSWSSLMIQLHHLSNCFSQLLLVRNFYSALHPTTSHISTPTDIQIPPPARPILLICFRLFALNALNHDARDFLTARAVNNSVLDALPDKILSLMSELRPHAVRLVDAWSIPDFLLDSALGRKDGKVYEDLFHRAHRLNPLNSITFNPYYWTDEIVMGEKNSGKDIESKL